MGRTSRTNLQPSGRSDKKKKMCEIFTHWYSFRMRHLHVGSFYSVKLYSQLHTHTHARLLSFLLELPAAAESL